MTPSVFGFERICNARLAYVSSPLQPALTNSCNSYENRYA